MPDELTYRLNILRLYSDTLKRIHVDPQTTKTTRKMLDEIFASGSSIFPLLVSGEPEKMARQTSFLRQCAEICNEILGDISRDPATPRSTHALITHTYIRLGYLAKHRPIAWLSSYDAAENEVAQRKIPPPRRPELRVYEPGNDSPHEIMVFRR